MPATEIGCDEVEEDPEKACQNALPKRCTSVCEAMDASAACCGVGDDVEAEAEVEPLGEVGGVGYIEAKEDGWCLPLRREVRAGEELLRRVAAEEK